MNEKKLVEEMEKAVVRLLGNPTLRELLEELGRRYEVEITVRAKEKTDVDEN